MRRKRILPRTFFASMASFAIVASISSAKTTTTVGWVSDVVGDWTANGKPIARSTGLQPGAIVRAVSSSRTPRATAWRIHIQLQDGSTRDSSCVKEPKACGFIALPSDFSPKSSWLNRLVESLARFTRGQPPSRDVNLITRVGYTVTVGSFRNSVLELDHGQLDVSPLFADLPPARYTIDFIEVDQSGRQITSNPVRAATIVWSNQSPSPTQVPGIKPGLYDTDSPHVNGSLVLVVDRTQYPKISRTYAQLVSTANRWGKNVSNTERDGFLRAALIRLAPSVQSE